jgi:methionyl-tRNA formyltransferase
MGTPPLAATVLNALTARDEEFRVVAVVTQPDQPKGRELKLQPSAVKELALKKNLPVLQPARARDPEFIQKIHELSPDLIVVAAYGQILPQTLLDVPKFGCLNVHTSLLPKYRGAAPIQWAILNGDAETGVTIMKMDAGLDTGAIVSEERTAIRDDDTAQTLHDRLAHIGGALLVRTIPEYVSGKIVPHPQPTEGSTYARKIKKDDGKLDWSQPARVLWNRVRGLTPWPGTYTFLQKSGMPPMMLKILRAESVDASGPMPGEILSATRDGIVVACGAGALRIVELQREGGKRLSAEQFLTGFPLQPGEKRADASLPHFHVTPLLFCGTSPPL